MDEDLTKPHGLRSFSLTGMIFLSISNHFTRIQSSRSQYFSSTNHLSSSHVIFISTFTEGLLQKASISIRPPADWSYSRDVTRRGLIVMHVVFRYLLKIFEYAATEACKQLQCNKARLLETASINGLHIHRTLGYTSRTNYAH